MCAILLYSSYYLNLSPCRSLPGHPDKISASWSAVGWIQTPNFVCCTWIQAVNTQRVSGSLRPTGTNEKRREMQEVFYRWIHIRQMSSKSLLPVLRLHRDGTDRPVVL